MPDERAAQGKPNPAIVRLAAKHEGNNVVIEVEDDGKGINPEIIKRKAVEKGLITQKDADAMDDQTAVYFIFHAGFSTSDVITDVSGRGVGLDAVRSKIESLSGAIQIDTKVGKGTRFKIQLPLTLAIIQALLVKLGDESYAIPLSSIDETTSIKNSQIKKVQDQEVILLRGSVLPLIRMHNVLDVPQQEITEESELYVVVVRKGDKQAGLIVDNLIGQQEIVIKSLGNMLSGITGIAGATILGNGQVSLILDVGSLF
jgi:two-component system, chemotaxis family, sensor kinase CheA